MVTTWLPSASESRHMTSVERRLRMPTWTSPCTCGMCAMWRNAWALVMEAPWTNGM